MSCAPALHPNAQLSVDQAGTETDCPVTAAGRVSSARIRPQAADGRTERAVAHEDALADVARPCRAFAACTRACDQQ